MKTWPLISGYAGSSIPPHWGAWFRVKGWGVHVGNHKIEDALFSERYGYTRAIYLLGLRFELLRPER